LKYHDDYLEAGLTPTFLPPNATVPGVYEKFVPLKFEEFDYDIEVEWNEDD